MPSSRPRTGPIASWTFARSRSVASRTTSCSGSTSAAMTSDDLGDPARCAGSRRDGARSARGRSAAPGRIGPGAWRPPADPPLAGRRGNRRAGPDPGRGRRWLGHHPPWASARPARSTAGEDHGPARDRVLSRVEFVAAILDWHVDGFFEDGRAPRARGRATSMRRRCGADRDLLGRLVAMRQRIARATAHCISPHRRLRGDRPTGLPARTRGADSRCSFTPRSASNELSRRSPTVARCSSARSTST